MHLVCRAKDKSEMKTQERSRKRYQLAYSLFCINLVWVFIHCESKMEKQGFRTGESRWQNSHYTAN